MKKLILSSAAVLLISLSAFASNNDKCCKKETKNCTPKECTKEANGKSTKCEFSPDQKCSKDKTQCHTNTASSTTKNTPKN